jgi:biotin carboxylase
VRPRVLLLLPTTSFKATAFLDAAERLAVDVVVGTDRRQALEDLAPGGTLTVDPRQPERSLRLLRGAHRERPFAAIVAADDETVVLAARAAHALGLSHNDAAAAAATRDKLQMRQRFAAAGLRVPRFQRLPLSSNPEVVAADIPYPCVVKPLALSGSRGVLRADDPASFIRAVHRVARLLEAPETRAEAGQADAILVEDFLPGFEVAVEGLLDRGRLRLLALFDKPDPLDGPIFEETLFITPSRLAPPIQQAIEAETAAGCRALGLTEGPVHAELRVADGQPWLIEVAARTIGGLCSRVLRFGTGVSLEEIVLRHALRKPDPDLLRERCAAGVMMIPTPGAGVLGEAFGLDRARQVPGVEEVTLTMHRGTRLVPLPEGRGYLGFIFARAQTPAVVEAALREAHRQLSFRLE